MRPEGPGGFLEEEIRIQVKAYVIMNLSSVHLVSTFGDYKDSQGTRINKDLTILGTMIMLTRRTIMSTINDAPPWL